MARRQGARALAPKVKRVIDVNEARAAIASHMLSLTSRPGVNMAMFRAQSFEQECVETLMGFVRDDELPPAIRRSCALDIVTIGRGAIRTWYHTGETVQPDAPGEAPGTTIGQEIQAARNTTELHEKLNKYVSEGVHSDDWPADIRNLVGDLINHYNTVPAIIDQ